MQDKTVNRFLHIGSDLVLSGRELIGIFSRPYETINAGFINNYRDRFLLRNISGRAASFMLSGRKNTAVYLSEISAKRLIKRAGQDITGG